MVLEPVRFRNLILTTSWMTGDSESGYLSRQNAGCKTARLSETKQMAMEPENKAITSIDADVVASSLLDAVPQILRFRYS
jgi:hypothetical protein